MFAVAITTHRCEPAWCFERRQRFDTKHLQAQSASDPCADPQLVCSGAQGWDKRIKPQWWLSRLCLSARVASATFAALTAVFAKVGVEGVNSGFATLIRTIDILVAVAVILRVTGHWQAPGSVSAWSYTFLVLSGLATGLSWLCYFRALQIGSATKVAPIDKLSVVLVAVFGVLFLRERLTALGWIGILLIGFGAVIVAVSS